LDEPIGEMMATRVVQKEEVEEVQVATVQHAESGQAELAAPTLSPVLADGDAPNADMLDAAAELLLGMLEERASFLILQTCEQQQLRPWMYVTGILRRALDTGEHTQPNVDPMWRTWGAWRTKVLQDSTCSICGKQFTPRWQGQLYDTNECGAVATRRERDAAVAAAPPAFVPTKVGEESAEQCKSTIGGSGSIRDGGADTAGDAISEAHKALSAAVEHTSTNEHVSLGEVG
jgi:hypothetical protein